MTLQNEDVCFGGNFPFIDIAPSPQWGFEKKLKAHIGESSWSVIRDHIKNRVGGCCEFCQASPGGGGLFKQKASPFKIDFRFQRDTPVGTDILRRIIYICEPCRNTIHLRQTHIKSEKLSPEFSPFIMAIDRLCVFYRRTPQQIIDEYKTLLQTAKEREDKISEINFEVYIVENGLNRLWK